LVAQREGIEDGITQRIHQVQGFAGINYATIYHS